MLDAFRKPGLGSIFFGGILVATISVFIIQFRPNSGEKTASLNQACVATVHGYCIDPKEQSGAFRLMIPRDSQGNLLTARANSMGLRKIAADGLIERELLVAEAERIGLTVSDDEVSDEIIHGFIHVSVPSDHPDIAQSLRLGDGRVYAGFKDPKTKQFDVKTYERNIRMLVGRSPAEFRESQVRELLAYKMRKIVIAPVRVSESEALGSYVNEKSSAEVTFIPVLQTFVSKYAVDDSDAAIQKWAADKDNAKKIDEMVTHRRESSDPKPNHIRHILIRVEKGASADQKSEALGMLAVAAARLKRGDAFADVAREMSQDPGSAQQGGDVGDKTDGFVAPFRDAANALKPGEVTPGAVETQFGYHLIEKDDPAKSAWMADALKKDATHELYLKAKSLEAGHDLAATILASLKAGKSPDDAAKEAVDSLKGKTLPTVPLVVLGAAKPAPAGDAGVTVTTPDKDADAGAASSTPEPPIVPKVFTAANDPDRPQAQTSNDFNRGGDPIQSLSVNESQKIIEFAFGGANKDGDIYPESLHGEDGFYLVQLKSHKVATKDEFEKDKDTYMQTLLAAKRAEALGIYVKRLRDAAKSEIKIDQAYLESPDAGTDFGEDDEGP